jgi:hypothetical protein
MSASLLAAALLSLPVHAGDLWLEVHADEDHDEVQLELPANWLAEEGEPIEVTVEGREFDLRAVARAAQARREGTRIQLQATDDGGQPYTVAVEHRRSARRSGPAPQTLTLDLMGEEGEGLQVRLPLLLGEGALTIASDRFNADIDMSGLEIPWEAEAFLAQLRAALPTTLVSIRSEDGCLVEIRTE